MSIMPALNRANAPAPTLNVTALALVLEQTEPELHTPGRLPGETLDEFAARRQAAADITADILHTLGSAA